MTGCCPASTIFPPGRRRWSRSNRSFIGAFLVGLNHELARELLWAEYPTDQRGTYSRRFWARRNTGTPADSYDLKQPLSASPSLTLEQLGESGAAAPSPLVLVVKGDLVQRYPGMLVTAAKTKLNGTIRALDPNTEIQPDFMARLEPDVLLVGFEFAERRRRAHTRRQRRHCLVVLLRRTFHRAALRSGCSRRGRPHQHRGLERCDLGKRDAR